MAETETIIANTDEKHLQQISDLKLQLNTAQQTITNLQEKLEQNEEMVLKVQLDSAKQIQALQDALKAAEEKVSKASNRAEKDQRMNQILEEYERTIAEQASEYKKLKELYESVQANLQAMETAFSDTIQKYERAKAVIAGFKSNEDILKESYEAMEKNLEMEADRYESLKAHASKQIEKANKEYNALKAQLDDSEFKHNAIAKRLEIKIASLQSSLDQKCKECFELAELVDKFTGKKL